MYIYSTPMCWQYIASRCAIISVSVEGTSTILPASKTVFKSADESPKFDVREGSKSFCLGFVL
jgi:hypothetical protein